MLNRKARLICLVAILTIPDFASAEVSIAPATAVEAIRLGNAALEHFTAERWDQALSGFRAADATMHSPVFGLYIARCLRRLGRWHEAVDVLKGVGEVELPPDAPEPWQQAQQDSRRELDELNEVFPTLTVQLSGADPRTVVSVDGHALMLEKGRGQVRLDPGSHWLVVTRAAQALESRNVELTPGRTARIVELGPYFYSTLTPSRRDGAKPNVGGEGEPQALPRKRESGGLMRQGAYASLGIGILGACVGTAAGLLAWHQRNALLERCGGWNCPAAEASQIEKGRLLGQISAAAFVTSAIGFSGALTLYLLAPSGVRTGSGIGVGYASSF